MRNRNIILELLCFCLDTDPLRDDPVFQRQVVGCQLVAGTLPGAGQGGEVVRTVGGRSLVIQKKSEELTVNDVPVTEIISVGDNQVITTTIKTI